MDSDACDKDRLIGGIEEWWWPRLLDQELEVTVVVDDVEYYPQPKTRRHLMPFIECYFLAVGRAKRVGEHQKSGRLNRFSNISPGSYGMQILPSELPVDFPEEKLGRIALIRSPKMVVEYAALGRPAPPAVGVFVADPEVDDILKLSEPPSHDRWDPNSARLELAKPDAGTARKMVEHIRGRLKSHMRNFQAQATPPRPSEERRLRFLERLLGALFRPQLRGDGHDSVTDPVEIQFREGPEVRPCGPELVQVFARVALRLRANAENETADVLVRVRIPVLEDDHGREGELLPVTPTHVNSNPAPVGPAQCQFAALLSKQEWFVFSLCSGPYDPRWSTRVDVEVSTQEAGF